jgi:hypothetical protein
MRVTAVLSDQLKEKLLGCIRHPIDLPAGARTEIEAYLLATIGLCSVDQGFPVEWGGAYQWEFRFDELGKPVPRDPPRTPAELSRARNLISIVVSRRGPYVTALSWVHGKAFDGQVGWVEERPISPRAIRLAQSVAERFDLTYLDAEELCSWELDRSVEDEAGIDLEASEPSGFTLLFYGY